MSLHNPRGPAHSHSVLSDDLTLNLKKPNFMWGSSQGLEEGFCCMHPGDHSEQMTQVTLSVSHSSYLLLLSYTNCLLLPKSPVHWIWDCFSDNNSYKALYLALMMSWVLYEVLYVHNSFYLETRPSLLGEIIIPSWVRNLPGITLLVTGSAENWRQLCPNQKHELLIIKLACFCCLGCWAKSYLLICFRLKNVYHSFFSVSL